MRLYVKVKLKAKTEQVKQIDPFHFEISVKEPPIEGRANEAVIRILAELFDIPKARLHIISGQTSRNKVLQAD
jgi:uncharacterized protein (TIGR00251 family)